MSGQIVAKFKAMGVHAVGTLAVALISSIFVFFIWYPGRLTDVMAGGKLYGIVLSVEIVLGPLMSLVIYSTKKSKKELTRDYAIVVAVQMAALVYGLYTAVNARPIYFVFVKDRIEAVSLSQLDRADLKGLPENVAEVSFYERAKVICVNIPADVEEKNELMWAAALAGKDIHLWPRYYRKCLDNEITDGAKPISLLSEKVKKIKDIDITSYEEAEAEFLWLPFMTPFGPKTVIIERGSGRIVDFLDFDPF